MVLLKLYNYFLGFPFLGYEEVRDGDWVHYQGQPTFSKM